MNLDWIQAGEDQPLGIGASAFSCGKIECLDPGERHGTGVAWWAVGAGDGSVPPVEGAVRGADDRVYGDIEHGAPGQV